MPLRIRSLLLNMSRYFYDDILAADSQAEFIASDKFLGAITIFIRETSSLNQLFDRKSPNSAINWGFLQVLKVLFEGQARQQQSVLALKKIFEPVYSQSDISVLRNKLIRLTERNWTLLDRQLQVSSDSSGVDELRQVLFDSKPHYCIVGDGSRGSDEGELSMESLLREN